MGNTMQQRTELAKSSLLLVNSRIQKGMPHKLFQYTVYSLDLHTYY